MGLKTVDSVNWENFKQTANSTKQQVQICNNKSNKDFFFTKIFYKITNDFKMCRKKRKTLSSY